MGYRTLADTVSDLTKHGKLVRVHEEISTDLEMAAVHRRIHAQGGPALFFENITGRKFPAVSNLFGTQERCEFLFRDSLQQIRDVFQIKANPFTLLNPRRAVNALRIGVHALPRKTIFNPRFRKCGIEEIPVVKSWPKDGGDFITLPLVYTEHPRHPGIMRSNLGMYRVQTSGNRYTPNNTMGLHYQLHRGIGIHHTAALEEGVPLKASVLVGGPPALILAAVMPLPETISEILFASMLGKRSFKYKRRGGYLLSPFVDFAIHGEISNQMLPEGPFGDHLGYYSLKHDFPHLKVDKILVRKKNAIWPFTVVGRPPQEDSEFGALIHSLTKDLISHEVPGVREVNAVDAAGVHPLLLAVGSERYLPYAEKKPREILTQANAILGFNQMSLAKYLFITAEEGSVKLSTHRVEDFLVHILERIDLTRDLHFQTCTTMDSLDYSGHALHEGSKLIVAAYGEKRRTLATVLPERAMKRYTFRDARLALAGVIVVRTTAFKDYKSTEYEMRSLGSSCREFLEEGIVLIVVADDAEYTAKNLDNFLWTTFTRSDPARDIYGVDSFTENKHWGAKGAIIIDARVKHHHAGMLVEDAAVSENINRFFKKGASLEKFH